MIHIFRIALAFLVITFGAAAIAQTTWWVDDNCGSKPDGSEAKPFCTIRDGINAVALSYNWGQTPVFKFGNGGNGGW